MGITFIDALVSGPSGRQRSVRFLVDSGATYSLLPHAVWTDLGLEPTRTITAVLADGTTIDRGVSECLFRLDLGSGHSPVILGEPGDEALLGSVTLENLGLVLNPFTRTLHPMRMLLA